MFWFPVASPLPVEVLSFKICRTLSRTRSFAGMRQRHFGGVAACTLAATVATSFGQWAEVATIRRPTILQFPHTENWPPSVERLVVVEFRHVRDRPRWFRVVDVCHFALEERPALEAAMLQFLVDPASARRMRVCL